MELLRFATAGSVDDGKTTLIGRLLLDIKQIFEDQLEAVERTSRDKRGDDYTNLALLTDGLRAEREQGITIDVAYRYFATPKRKFIIADTPGHMQYTRNMVTGASTADLALSWSTPARACSSSPAATPSSPRCCGSRTSCSASTRWTSSTTTQEVFEEISDEFTEFAAKLDITDLDLHPDLGAARRQRRRALAQHAVVRRARRCCTTSRTSTSPPTAT